MEVDVRIFFIFYKLLKYPLILNMAADDSGVFNKHSTRDENELTGNITMDRGLSHFTEGLSAIFVKMARALKPGAPLAFTYHHNTIKAYLPVAVAILDAGLTCSALLPCPAGCGTYPGWKREADARRYQVYSVRAFGSSGDMVFAQGLEYCFINFG